MSKNNKSNNQNNNNGRNIKIRKEVEEFAKASFKKFKKKEKDYYDTKKELKSAFNSYLIELLPDVIEFVVRYGYIRNDNVQETKRAAFEKIADKDFVKVMKKEVKQGNDVKNMKLMPIIIKEFLAEADRVNKELLANDPNAKLVDMSDMIELSKMILKKRLKKAEKAGIDPSIAFDLLSIIPTDESMKISQNYRVHMLYECMYEHSKTKEVPFDKIMETLIDDDMYSVFIVFALLERKEKFGTLTDSQKVFYMAVSTWVFATMESMSKDDIEAIIRVYVNNRKRDEVQNKDGNRRYALSTLTETDYPKIAKTIRKMITDDESIKKYL